ncbi:kinetochore protein NDC80 homolog isoform X2 [Hydra vulgaris]|uniref:Kinetochore protein NDC80 n=1 Tax=Hydra vulgaris TaxID=6087 RepID=A0ABM4D874_HYDVU
MASNRRNLQTPQSTRKSILGFGSAAAKLRQQETEKRHLSFGTASQSGAVGNRRWSTQGAHNSQGKDQRPLSNRNYQKQMIDEILELLNNTGYPHSISTKNLSSPTTKDFSKVFEHLYGLINANFVMDKKLEEEVPRILKSLGYPFPIAKSSLFSIGSLHSWPPLLGVLHWMVELIKTIDKVNVEEILYPGFDDEADQQKIFLQYASDTYRDFLVGKEDFSKEEQALLTASLTMAGCSIEDYESLSNDVDELKKELAKLESEPDVLQDAVREKMLIEEGIQEDEMTIEKLDQELVVLKHQSEQLEEQMQAESLKYRQKKGNPANQAELKTKSSEVCNELQKLNNEKDRLEEANHESEIRFSKSYDLALDILNKYNDIAEELTFNPLAQKVLQGNSIKLHFDHKQNDLSLFNGNKDKAKILLTNLKKIIAEEKCRLKSDKSAEVEKFVECSELLKLKQYELASLQATLNSLKKEDTDCFEKECLMQLEKIREEDQLLENEVKKLDQLHESLVQHLLQLRKSSEESLSRRNQTEDDLADYIIAFHEKIEEGKKKANKEFEDFNQLLLREKTQMIHQLKSLNSLEIDNE